MEMGGIHEYGKSRDDRRKSDEKKSDREDSAQLAITPRGPRAIGSTEPSLLIETTQTFPRLPREASEDMYIHRHTGTTGQTANDDPSRLTSAPVYQDKEPLNHRGTPRRHLDHGVLGWSLQ